MENVFSFHARSSSNDGNIPSSNHSNLQSRSLSNFSSDVSSIYSSFKNETQGTQIVVFLKKPCGLGLTGGNPVKVLRVTANGEADQNGVLVGDSIIKVNGVTVAHLDHDSVVNKIKNAGIQVVITLLRTTDDTQLHKIHSFNSASESSLPPAMCTPLPNVRVNDNHFSFGPTVYQIDERMSRTVSGPSFQQSLQHQPMKVTPVDVNVYDSDVEPETNSFKLERFNQLKSALLQKITAEENKLKDLSDQDAKKSIESIKQDRKTLKEYDFQIFQLNRQPETSSVLKTPSKPPPLPPKPPDLLRSNHKRSSSKTTNEYKTILENDLLLICLLNYAIRSKSDVLPELIYKIIETKLKEKFPETFNTDYLGNHFEFSSNKPDLTSKFYYDLNASNLLKLYESYQNDPEAESNQNCLDWVKVKSGIADLTNLGFTDIQSEIIIHRF